MEQKFADIGKDIVKECQDTVQEGSKFIFPKVLKKLHILLKC